MHSTAVVVSTRIEYTVIGKNIYRQFGRSKGRNNDEHFHRRFWNGGRYLEKQFRIPTLCYYPIPYSRYIAKIGERNGISRAPLSAQEKQLIISQTIYNLFGNTRI